MKEDHIINILEGASFANLSESDHKQIRAHSAGCVDCARAYKVAMVSATLLQERAAETIEPSPFFHTKVLAAIREQRDNAPAFQRLWRAAGALVSSMAAVVVLLGALSFITPDTQSTFVDASSLNASAEEVILNEFEQAEDQVSDAQVLSTLYGTDDDER